MCDRYFIHPVTEKNARDFIGWRYSPPYDIYNLDEDADVDDVNDAVAFFLALGNGYLTVHSAEDQLVGFCCFGLEGQVPGGDYSLDALDVGIGMRPELTGKGLGYAFVGAVLTHAERTYAPRRLRVTIALFNRRSQRVFQNHGFRRQSQFLSATARPREYVILVKEVGNVD